MLDSQTWRCVEAQPAMVFRLDQAPARASRIASAEGIVGAVSDGRLTFERGEERTLAFTLPEAIDLQPLVGARVRVTVCHTPLSLGPMGQLLTISDGPRVLLLAHHGPAEGNVHRLGAFDARVALSQRSRGPIAIAAAGVRCLVRVGEHVKVEDEGTVYVFHHVARSAAGYAAYVIADRSLWSA